MAINIATIETVLLRNGFSVQHETKKRKELIHNRSRESVYLNKADPKRAYSQLLVHPRHIGKRESLRQSGQGIGSSAEKSFGSNLSRFPAEIRHGKTPCPYGVPFGFDSTESLKAFLADIFG